MYRSDVVGSLLRPRYLKQARDRHEKGGFSDADFKRVEDRAVDEAIALQVRTDMEVITDGEMRRYAFYGHLIDAVEGLTGSEDGQFRFAMSRVKNWSCRGRWWFRGFGANVHCARRSLPICGPVLIVLQRPP